jgi:hypothetical protein
VFNSKVGVNYLVVKNFFIEDVFCASISAAVLVHSSKAKANYLVDKFFLLKMFFAQALAQRCLHMIRKQKLII